MKRLEFETQLGADATIKIPAECARQIDVGQAVRVVLLVPEADDEFAWAELTTEQFLQGYTDTDANSFPR